MWKHPRNGLLVRTSSIPSLRTRPSQTGRQRSCIKTG
ncbi:hypothetical protein LEMLEM_LOCUS10750 [Lemmus lemmus]